jgi:hypothetical protein
VSKLTTPSKAEPSPAHHGGLRQFFSDLGPGLITGAADDDPSGISTYSVAGAAYGYATLWTALLSFPLMATIQLMCARLGMVIGCGLASVIRTRLGQQVLRGDCYGHRDRTCIGFCRTQRSEDAILVGDPEWSAGPSACDYCRSADQ